jgi:hypothetical protein
MAFSEAGDLILTLVQNKGRREKAKPVLGGMLNRNTDVVSIK